MGDHSSSSLQVNNSYQEEYGEVLHAIRDVAKGEELCITYIEPAQQFSRLRCS
jgi:SET domain-containing protein